MAFLKFLVPLATLVVMAYCSEIGLFYLAYSLAPFGISENLESAWESCPENTTNQETYQAVLDEAHKCYNNITFGNQSICHSLRNRVQKCFLPIVDFFVDCFPDRAKDLPPAISKAATSLVEVFCTSSGDVLLEALNPCLYEYAEHENNNTKKECRAENIRNKLENFEKHIPTKVEACNAFQEIGDCYQEYVNHNCGSLASTNFFSKFYNAALTPCK